MCACEGLGVHALSNAYDGAWGAPIRVDAHIECPSFYAPPADRLAGRGAPQRINWGEEGRPFWLPEDVPWDGKLPDSKKPVLAKVYDLALQHVRDLEAKTRQG